MGQPLRVGRIGCGAISGQYLTTIARLPQPELGAVADRDQARADRIATEQGVRAPSAGDLLADPDIDAVLNLTIPAAHAEVALAAISAGKIVDGEKPLAAGSEQARQIVGAASTARLRIGCAPDTVLGTGIQTARQGPRRRSGRHAGGRFGDDGHPRSRALAPGPGLLLPARWRPLLDMGPYDACALVTLLGPVSEWSGCRAVSGRHGRSAAARGPATRCPSGSTPM